MKKPKCHSCHKRSEAGSSFCNHCAIPFGGEVIDSFIKEENEDEEMDIFEEMMLDIPPNMRVNVIPDPTIVVKMLEYIDDLGVPENILTFNKECIPFLVEKFPSTTIYYMGMERVVDHDNVKVVKCDLWDIEEAKSMIKKINKKFDVVIGNPPYQDPVATSSKKLWPEFFKLAFDYVKDDGYVALITPNSWQTPKAQKSRDLFKYFKENRVRAVCLNANEYFPNIGVAITWYVIKKTKNNNFMTEMVDEKNKEKTDLSKLDFLPVKYSKNTISVINKLITSPSMGIDTNSFCHSQQAKVSKEKNEQFKFPVKHGNGNNSMLYSHTLHPVAVNNKVLFHKSGAIVPVYDAGKLGVSEDVFFMEVNSANEGGNLCAYLESKIVKFLMLSTTYAMNMSKEIVRKIPAIDLSRSWTDEELYAYFNLTTEEIAHVENTIAAAAPKRKRAKADKE